ncbi:MAG: redox-sensing transcriptional repressor Rex [Gemmatimonadaceae bacterium]
MQSGQSPVICEEIHKQPRETHLKRIADSTVRRLSLYLRFLEDSTSGGLRTISSEELARRGGTTSAQVRKDLSFFGSFGKRGLGYSVPELSSRLREILGLEREWRVIIVGAGKIGSALAQYRGFAQRGFVVTAVYDSSAARIGGRCDGHLVRDVASLEADTAREAPDIAVLTVPAGDAQQVVDRLVAAGIRAILNFAPVQIQAPADVTIKTVNMAMELEGLSFALASRGARDSEAPDED